MLTEEKREELENLRIDLQAQITTLQITQPNNKKLSKLKKHLKRVMNMLEKDSKEQYNSLEHTQVNTVEELVNSRQFITVGKLL